MDLKKKKQSLMLLIAFQNTTSLNTTSYTMILELTIYKLCSVIKILLFPQEGS